MISVDVPYPDTVDELADVLRERHVLVHETQGSGDTAGALARIGRLVEQLPFATYVAMVEVPAEVDAGNDSGRYLATALSRRIGKPGLYVVDTPRGLTGVRMVGTGWDEPLFSLQSDTDAEAVERASGSTLLTPTVDAEVVLQTALHAPPRSEGYDYDEVSLPDSVVDDLADRERSLEPFERPGLEDEPPEPWSEGKRWMVGTAVGAGVLAVLLQSLWGWPGWRRRRGDRASTTSATTTTTTSAAPAIEQVREAAGTQLTALAESLPAVPAGERLDRATLAREAAEPLVASDDLLDVIGALVLAEAGRREVALALGRARTAYRVCFFDPGHAGAGHEAAWRFGDTEVEVPVCRRCRQAITAGREPESLRVPHRGRLRPYYELDSVWAETGFGSLTSDLADLATRVTGARRRR